MLCEVIERSARDDRELDSSLCEQVRNGGDGSVSAADDNASRMSRDDGRSALLQVLRLDFMYLETSDLLQRLDRRCGRSGAAIDQGGNEVGHAGSTKQRPYRWAIFGDRSGRNGR